MPTDATGTATSLGIPKFNTSVDAPSGLGSNAQMDSIDALIAARVLTPTGVVTGDVPVWNGSTFVRSSTTRINNGGQLLPTTTTSSFSGGPPGGAVDGDIWIATNPLVSGTARWMFQRDAVADPTYPWYFIGGGPAYNFSATGYTNNTLGTYQIPGGNAITITRAGLYLPSVTARAANNTGSTIEVAASPMLGGFTTGVAPDAVMNTGTVAMLSTFGAAAVTAAAAQVLDLGFYTGSVSGTSVTWTNRVLSVIPLRVA